MKRNLWKILATLLVLAVLAACATPTPEVVKEVVTQVVKETVIQKETVKETVIVEGTPQVVEKEVTRVVEVEKEITKVVEVEKVVTPTPETVMTDVDTPRNETMIFQTFDRQTVNPDQHNPLMAYAHWRGFRELAWGWLWEMDTGTGQPYPELAAEMPEVLNDEHTKFRIKLKEGIYWSDGVEFTADDVIYSLDVYFEQQDKLTQSAIPVITRYVKSYSKIDDYTLEVETVDPAFDFVTSLGVKSWGGRLIIVPKHIFEQQEDISAFRNTYPVTLGPYTVKEFDPSGFWQLWELREDWQRSAWGWMDEDGYMPQYILYKDFGPEETRSLAFVQNEYDLDTFMSPDSIKAAQSRSEHIKTFSPRLPYHNMDDACGYGVLMNVLRPPLDLVEVRWALALSLDLKSAGIHALSGEMKVSPIPMVDWPVLRPIYYDPLLPWLRDFELADGYKPFDEGFAADLADNLREIGVAESEIPQTEEALSEAFGIGWWKYDPAEAENLLTSVGFTKNDEGNWLLPDGEEWQLQLVIPGDWNKVMQRVGFSMADSWKKSGIQVNVRQADYAEYDWVEEHNVDKLGAILNWTNCHFVPNYLYIWKSYTQEFINDVDSDEYNYNQFQWGNETVDGLILEAVQLDNTTEEFYEIGRSILKEYVTNMAYINVMNIPTTIPSNEYYWTNFPKQDNYYAQPYSWWSSIKETIVNVEPTGR
jgi:peptide/nickel transport system substrate-binding protein